MAMTYGRFVGFAFCAASLLQVNEAISSSGEIAFGFKADATKLEMFTASKLELKAQLETDSSAMSVEHAMKILHASNHTSAKLLGFLQDNLGHRAFHGKKQTGGKQQKQLEPESPGADVQADYGSGLKNAMVRLNEMMLETITNMDAEDLECKQFSRSQQFYITELESDLQYYQRVNTGGSARVLDARGQRSSYQDKIPVVKAELLAHNKQCVDEMGDLHRQLIIARGDAQVMDKILNMTECNDAATLNKVFLLQCVDKSTGRHFTKLQPNDPALKKELAKLKHPKSLEVVKRSVMHNYHRVALVQQGRSLRNGQGPPGVPDTAGMDGDFQYGVKILNASADPNLEAGAEECSIANSSKCPQLRERFTNIAGGVADAIEDLENMIENKQERCGQIRTDLNAEMSHYGYWFEVWEARHAAATAELGETRTQFKNKVKELGNAKQLYSDKMESCEKFLADAKSELCALHKIRGELATMSAWDDEITDCMVGDWDTPACPVTCGGGIQQLSRIVTMMAGAGSEDWNQGHKCPLLKAQQSCNEFRCPIDCELSDWEEWSKCTVTCGGGVHERLRTIVWHPTPQGNPCELTLETVLCNSGPCDEDCELSDWTEWSTTCSKMCDSGQQTRIKTLVTAEKGAGTCDKFYNPSRFQTKPCNTQLCRYQTDVVLCVAPVDVILVIDGSGSMGTEGWNAIKHTSLSLARAIHGGSTLGALLFSGPASGCARSVCTGAPLSQDCDPTWKDAQMTPADCGMEWISHLTADTDLVIKGLEAMSCPNMNTLTSKALKLAEVELVNSRKGVPSVVIVLTDGFPYSHLHTKANALALKDSGARLMWVPIGPDVADTTLFEGMASYPWQDNLVFASTFEELIESNATVNKIVFDFCMDFNASYMAR